MFSACEDTQVDTDDKRNDGAFADALLRIFSKSSYVGVPALQ